MPVGLTTGSQYETSVRLSCTENPINSFLFVCFTTLKLLGEGTRRLTKKYDAKDTKYFNRQHCLVALLGLIATVQVPCSPCFQKNDCISIIENVKIVEHKL